jgi:hypothetical protein
MRAGGGDALGKEPAGGHLARCSLADEAAAADKVAKDSGADCALKVKNHVITDGTEFGTQGANGTESFKAERFAAPVLGGRKVNAVDDRLRGAADSIIRCREQGAPAGLDDPIYHPARVHLTQSRDCWQCVEDVTHGAQADHKKTKLGLRLQALIFSQGGLYGLLRTGSLTWHRFRICVTGLIKPLFLYI